MAAFINKSLDCDPNEFEGIFDDDSDDIGFENLLAQVTYNNDLCIVSPICSRCISPLLENIPSVPSFCENPSYLALDEKPLFESIVNSDVHVVTRPSSVSLPIQGPPFPDFGATSGNTNNTCAQLLPQKAVIEHVAPPKKGMNKTTRGTVSHKVAPALSAYNFFFRDERDRILNGASTYTWTRERQELLLRRHWQQDRSQKRRHVKTHGKINFATLSKSISMSWKQLPESCKDFYREISLRDWERFRQENSALEALECKKR